MQFDIKQRIFTTIFVFGAVYMVISSVTAAAGAPCSAGCECYCEYKHVPPYVHRPNKLNPQRPLVRGVLRDLGTVHVDGARTGWLGTGDCITGYDDSQHAAQLCGERKAAQCVNEIKRRHPDRPLIGDPSHVGASGWSLIGGNKSCNIMPIGRHPKVWQYYARDDNGHWLIHISAKCPK